MPRFLCIHSPSKPQLLPRDPIYLNIEFEAKVHNRWSTLLNIDLIRPQPVIIFTDNDVHPLYRDYYNSSQKRLGPYGDISTLGAPFAGRWAEMSVRITGVFQMYEFSTDKSLSSETFQKR